MKTLATIVLSVVLPACLLAGTDASVLREAAELAEKGELDLARPVLERVLAEDPENPIALKYFGRCLLADQELDRAVETFKALRDLDPESSQVHLWYGRALTAKVQASSGFERGILAGRALEALKRAVALDPGNTDARIQLANYYLNAPAIGGGSPRKAREQAEAIQSSDPVRGTILLARVLVRQGKTEDAIRQFETALESAPDKEEIYYQLGMLHQGMEDWDKAFSAFEKALEMNPLGLASLYQMGRTAVFAERNLDRGVACLREYLRHDPGAGYPGPDAAHWRLGMLYQHRGDLELARAEFETALEIEPAKETYREALENLGSQERSEADV